MGVLVLTCASGCKDQGSEKENQKIQALEKDVARLTSELRDANRKIEALGAVTRVSKDSCDELRDWADLLVKSYGKGIWYPSDSVYPLFVKAHTGDVQSLIEELNRKFRADKLPEVIYLGSEKDNVMVGVSDDEQLARRMGSFGAQSYMNAVVFTLASVQGVSCVEFKFEEGDHASPGVYCRRFVKP